jgi:hypothetical protein
MTVLTIGLCETWWWRLVHMLSSTDNSSVFHGGMKARYARFHRTYGRSPASARIDFDCGIVDFNGAVSPAWC